jgi:hypothetical protein
MAARLTGLAPQAALVVQLRIAVVLGAGFGAIFRYQPESAAREPDGSACSTAYSGGSSDHSPCPRCSAAWFRPGRSWDAAAGFPGLIACLVAHGGGARVEVTR